MVTILGHDSRLISLCFRDASASSLEVSEISVAKGLRPYIEAILILKGMHTSRIDTSKVASLSSPTRLPGQAKPFQIQRQPNACRKRQVLLRAQEDEGFQDKIKKLKEAQKKDGVEEKQASKKDSPQKGTKTKKVDYDFTGEQLHFESAPHRGDLATNIAFGATLLWLPLTFAAIGRAAFVKYRFTDKRISVITEAPWKKEQLDAAYQEVSDVQTVGRGVGLWGDMVVTLRNNNKIEMRSLPKFLELKSYILERKDALAPANGQEETNSVEKIKPKGFGGKN